MGLMVTLPAIVGKEDYNMVRRIFQHSVVTSARINSGADRPKPPLEAVAEVADLAKRAGKDLYLDLEGRQVRVAAWKKFDAANVVLNRDFTLELPGVIHLRGFGWYKIAAVDAPNRKIYFDAPYGRSLEGIYVGESQSVFVDAQHFEVEGGYLSEGDKAFIEAGLKTGVKGFLLSFAERTEDVLAVINHIKQCDYWGRAQGNIELILKIESKRGASYVSTLLHMQEEYGIRIVPMAARDDLYLAFQGDPAGFMRVVQHLPALHQDAIAASGIFSGILRSGIPTIAELSDLVFLKSIGYRHLMLGDELNRGLDIALAALQGVY